MVDRTDYPLVYIIILNWNGWQHTLNCVTSLERVKYPNLETIVIDNGSEDDSVERIKASFPDLQLLQMDTNLGFTGGNNQGIRHALEHNADYILLLNNDVIVDPDFLDIMVETVQNEKRLGALNPKIYYLEGDHENVLWSTGGKINLWLAASGNRGRDQTDRGQYDRPADIDFGSGCCLLMSRAALSEIGLLNDAYFAYYEDVDWSFRLRKKGLAVGYVPQAKVWHAVGASSRGINIGKGSQSPFIHFLAARNHLWFVRSYATRWQKLTAYPAYFVRRMLYYSAAFVFLRRWEKLNALWKGFWAGIRHYPN